MFAYNPRIPLQKLVQLLENYGIFHLYEPEYKNDYGYKADYEPGYKVESYKPSTSTSTTEAPVFENIEIVERKDSEDMFQPDYFYPEADNATEVTAVDGIKDPTPEDIANLLAMVDDVEQVSRLVEKFNK